MNGYSLGVPTVSGQHAYVSASFYDQVGGTNRTGLEVLDVSDPLRPRKVGGYDVSVNPLGIALSGRYAYLTDEGWYDGTNAQPGGLLVLDISNPASPQPVSGYNTDASASKIVVSSTYAYLVQGQVWTGSNTVGSLEIVDISSPASPNLLGGFETGRSINAVAVSGHYAYVAADKAYDAGTQTHVGGGLQILDVSDPVQPQKIGEWDPTGTAFDVTVVGNYAYVAAPHYYDTATGSYDGGLRVIDISDPANPSQAASYDLPGEDVWGVTVSGADAYLAAEEGLVVIDISDSRNPRRTGGYPAGGPVRSLAVAGNYAFLADGVAGLEVLDVSRPANPKRVAGYVLGNTVDGVAVSGNYAYVTDGSWIGGNVAEYLDVVDISDPANPKWTGGRHAARGSMSGAAFSGSIAYNPDQYGGVDVFDLSDPTNPQLVGNLPETMDGTAYGVALSGPYAFVADGREGLEIADISDPTNMVEIARYPTGGEALGVATLGNYAYVASRSGLHVVDISNPSSPQRVGWYDTNTVFSSIVIAGNYGYLVQAFGGLQVIDISDPAKPLQLGANDMTAYDFAVSGNFIYVAGGFNGLQILAVSQPTLSFRLNGNNLSLSWPTNSAGFVLQSATTLANGGDWKDSNLASATVGDQNLVTVDTTTSPSAFFRLR